GGLPGPEGAPVSPVGVLQRAVFFGPLHEPIAGLALVRVVAGPVLLRLVEGRDPDVVIHETRPLPPPRIGRGHRERVVHRQELVGHRLADRVEHRRVDDSPRAGGLQLPVVPRLLLPLEQRRHPPKPIPPPLLPAPSLPPPPPPAAP